MNLYGFNVNNNGKKDIFLILIYSSSFYRNISSGYIVSSIFLDINKNKIIADILYDDLCININLNGKILYYNIENTFIIDNSKYLFIKNLLSYDFGCIIKSYIGYIDIKTIDNYSSFIQNT